MCWKEWKSNDLRICLFKMENVMEWNGMKMEWEDCMKIDGFVKYASRKFSDTVRSHVHAWITAIVFDCGNE